MQYLLPKRRFLPTLLAAAFLASAISCYILAKMNAVGALFMPYLATLSLAAALYTVGRFLVFGIVYCLGDDYADLSFTVHRVYQKTSTKIAQIELDGNEELTPYDKSGRKKLRRRKKLGVYTANLVLQGYFALTCTLDGIEGFILLELDKTAKDLLEARIQRAKLIHTIDQDPKETI